MIFDDHDVRDDWNTSDAWLRDIRSTSWWQDRIEAALMSYWIYQHLGNLAPGEIENSALLAQLRDAADGEPVLREFARHADRNVAGVTPVRWSYHRDLGAVRLLVVDSRCGRVVDADKRAMVGPEEWAWVEQHARGTFDHLLIATSLPFLLPEGIHHLEAWNEATCDGRWGKRFARTAERLRQRADLEHWAAFGRSFAQMTQLVADVASGDGPARRAHGARHAAGHHHVPVRRRAFLLPGRGAFSKPGRDVADLPGGLLPVAQSAGCRHALRSAGGRHPGRDPHRPGAGAIRPDPPS